MQILITTQKGTFDITALVPSVKWSGDYQQAARTLDFTVVSSPSDKSIPFIECPLGAAVQMRHGKQTLFDGFIVSRTKSTDASAVSLSCYDRGFYLKRNKASYKFSGVTPETAVAMIAADFDFQTGVVAKTDIPLSRLFITGTSSLYDIISTMYTLAGRTTKKQYHIGFQGDKLCVTVKAPDARTLILQGQSNLITAVMSDSIEKMVNAVAIYDANGTLIRKLEDAQTIKLYGRLQEVRRQTAKDDQSAAAQKLLDDNGISQRITVDCLGNIANVTGGTVVMREPYTGLYGLFYIDADTHEWKRGQYYNKLVLNFKCLMNEKEAGSLPNADGGLTGGDTAAAGSWEYINKPA